MREKESVVCLITRLEFPLAFHRSGVHGFSGSSNANAFRKSLHWSHDEARGYEDGNVAVRFWVHTLTVEPEILGQSMDEGPLVCWHRFEAEPLLCFVGSKNAEFPFLHLGPSDTLPEHLQGVVGVRDMIIFVCIWVDVKGLGQPLVPQEPSAFVITG